MELHQLRYFVAVAETGSFTRAAGRCLVAQPSLSQQIQKLERSLRKPLFDRLGKRIKLTDAGEALLPRARRILDDLEETSRALREDGQAGEGRLHIGVIPTIGPYLLPSVLSRFLRCYPRVKAQLHEEVTANLLSAMHQGELDLALLALPITDTQLQTLPLRCERLLVGLPRRHRLTRKKRIAPCDLVEEPFILLGDMHCLTEQVTAYCQSAFVPRIACRCVQLSTIQTLIGLGMGVSLLPEMACRGAHARQIAYRHIESPEPTRQLGVIWHKHRNLSATVRAFMQMLKPGALAEDPSTA
jgi:LysR family transcriptional regulator, hydrogen peroxide-inducible genes activator